MYNIEFYRNQKGQSQLLDFLENLHHHADRNKNYRIQYEQSLFCIELLQKRGFNNPSTVAKHITGELWELRPGNNRIFYFYFDKNTFVLLHQFRKKSQKTPSREIQQAFSEIDDWKTRHKEGK